MSGLCTLTRMQWVCLHHRGPWRVISFDVFIAVLEFTNLRNLAPAWGFLLRSWTPSPNIACGRRCKRVWGLGFREFEESTKTSGYPQGVPVLEDEGLNFRKRGHP